jgi:hypothetical protein
MPMRLCVIITGVVALAVIAGIWTYLALTGQETSGPQSSGLAISVVGYTNQAGGQRHAMLEVINRGGQSIWLNDFVAVHYFDTIRNSDWHSLTNAGELKPGATQLFCFPAPNHQLRWRAEFGGVNQREITVKQRLRGTVLLKDYPFVLHPHYSQTEWITP